MPSADGGRVAVPPPDRRRALVALPAWFEVGLLAVVTGVVTCGGLGLALAVGGVYSPVVAIAGGLLLAVALTVPGARALIGRGGPRPDRAGVTTPAVTAVLLATGSAVWNGWRSGGWLNIDRDPAAYALAARWISDHGSLQIPFGDSWAFTGAPVVGGSAAVYDDGPVLEFQFDHLLPALLAEVRDVGGDAAMFAANAVVGALGLLAVYAVGARLTGRPWPTLVATAGFGLSLPLLYVSRTTFSEPLAMLLLWAGAWLLLAAWDRAPRVLGLLGGLALGASVMARVDSLVHLLVLPLLAAVLAVAGARAGVGDDRRRRVATVTVAALLGAAVPVAIGTVDLMARAGQYYDELTSQIVPLQLATVATVMLGLAVVALAPRITRRTRGILDAASRHRVTAGRSAAGVVVVVLVLAWFVRPVFDRPTGRANSTVTMLQKVEGLPAEPGRLYAERSLTWLSWYLGPAAVALAVIGLGLLVVAAVRGNAAALVVLAVAGAGSALYLYRLSNTPDQVWGARRFVPATMPLSVLAAAWTLAAAARAGPAWLAGRSARLARAWPRLRVPVLALLAVGVVAFPAVAVWPVRDFSPRRGSAVMFTATCDAIGPDAAVVFAGRSYGELSYPQTLRDLCGVPVATSNTALTAAQLEQAAAAWRGRGRTLWLLDSDPASLRQVLGEAADVRRLGQAVNPDELVDTLSRRPATYETWTQAVYGLPVPG